MGRHRLYRRYRGKRYPTVEAVFYLHEEVLKASGGAPGVRNPGALESALDKPFSTVGGVDAYPTFFSKVAAIGYFITKPHPFVDGNKRTALQTMMLTLGMNGYKCKPCARLQVATMVLTAMGHLDPQGLRTALLLWCELDPASELL
ncbi:type II toxin-antitoxin system death-on-curing family toxin [Marinithermus hydrothermalis]|uniref:Death-on-curing family protein n=1 Tax=Marinithermus hydrothermalis (strain DSM 14884 / JCM 11576 / T1) TaxID=869210 RepID=F2NK65_MARHT|nr:type II toxin-antitoxin system death-on-curing family toxin [Marinithermus hydrothermalis]AEB12036.1 death-on-curing family protein [Marinithermus hydrothermalis DSM 14884]